MENHEGLFANTQHIDIQKSKIFDAPVQVFSIWLKKKYHDRPFNNTIKAIDFFYDEVQKNSTHIRLACTYEDILINKKNNLMSGIISIEGGEALEGETSALSVFHHLGVRMLTLTWNYANDLGCGAMVNSHIGLTDFGKEVVLNMEQLGMIVDVSHLNEAGFWDVYHLSTKPFVASHSNCFSLCDHKRNLNDAQIKAIAEKGGLIGINLYPPFLEKNGIASIEDIVRHVVYIQKLVGCDYIGLGADFDGIDQTPAGITDITSLIHVYEALTKQIGESNTIKIFSDNYLNLFSKIL